MNAQPELPGESTDPCFERFLEGLGLVDGSYLMACKKEDGEHETDH